MNTNDFEQFIASSILKYPDNLLREAMEYALSGGKRFRCQLIFAILKGFGIDEKEGYEAALALEFIQTYSLIHDDLPGMDNDDLRRGKPTVHKQFGEDIAILAGDALLTHSFSVLAESHYKDRQKIRMITALANYAGLFGMIYGQLLDVTFDPENNNKEKLFAIQDNKTGGLFKIACLFASIIAEEDKDEFYCSLGSQIGVVFQNQDDLFDRMKTEAEMGKSLSDLTNNKPTALTIYSLEKLQQLIKEQFLDLRTYLKQASFDPLYLNELLDKLINR